MAGVERLRPLDRPRFMLLDLPKEPFVKRLAQLKSEQAAFLSEWMEIAQFIQPRRGRFLQARDGQQTDRRSSKIINTTASDASRTLKSGMQSGASSPARPWFRLTMPDQDLAEQAAAKAWLTTVSRRMAQVFQRSNIYNCLHTGYGDLGDFGQSVMVIDEDYDSVIRCYVYPIGSYYLAADARGMVNTIYREFTSTVIQMMQRWGRANVSPTVANMYDNGSHETPIPCVEVIEPNASQIRGVPGPAGMPFIRVHYEVGSDADKVLSVHGCHEFPACCPRWDVQAGDVYGHGPGLAALNDVKGLQLLETRKAIMVDKGSAPPTQGPSTVGKEPLRNGAGQHNVFNETGASAGAKIVPIYEPNPVWLQALRGEIEAVEARINRAYFADLFLMMAQSDRREITAREIDERHEEKLLALGPVIERLHDENLDPAITRTFNVMQRAGMIPEPPPELHDAGDLKVEFISLLAQAQKAVSVGSIEKFSGFVARLGAVQPSVFDKIDTDQAADEYADAIGVPPSMVVPDDKVKEIRADRAKTEQNKAMVAAAAQGADTAKVMAETPITDGTLLGNVLSGVGAA